MQPTTILPEEYEPNGVFDINNMRLALLLNGIGVGLLFVFGWLFIRLADSLNQEYEVQSFRQLLSQYNWWGLLLTLVGVVVLHELAHALFFWLFTKKRPFLGIGPGYAYAAAPDWYFPRNQFLIIGLAPLVMLSAAGLLLVPFVGKTAVAWITLFITLNGAGAVGDLYVCGWLLARPATTLIRDEGPVIHLFSLVKASPSSVNNT